MPIPVPNGFSAKKSSRSPQDEVRSPEAVRAEHRVGERRPRGDEQRRDQDDRDAVDEQLVAVERQVQQAHGEAEHRPADEREEHAEHHHRQENEEDLAAETPRVGERHRQRGEDRDHQVEAERERLVERRERPEGEPGGEPDRVVVRVPHLVEVLVAHNLLPEPEQRGHPGHEHEDRDERVAVASVQRAAPDGETDQGGEVGQTQTDERGGAVHPRRREDPERDQDQEDLHPGREPPPGLGAGLRRADEREQQQPEGEDLLPRVGPARRELLDDPVEGQHGAEQQDPALGPEGDRDHHRDGDGEDGQLDAVPQQEGGDQDHHPGAEDERRALRTGAQLLDDGGHRRSTLPAGPRSASCRPGGVQPPAAVARATPSSRSVCSSHVSAPAGAWAARPHGARRPRRRSPGTSRRRRRGRRAPRPDRRPPPRAARRRCWR